MPRKCTVCAHPQRPEIDKAILAGESYRGIAGRFKPLASSSIERHRNKCVSTALERAKERETWTITGQMRDLCFCASRTLETAEKSGKVRDVTLASREARETLMALARLTGELDESTRVNVMIAQREAQDGEQLAMLERLTVEERIQLHTLIAKAQGESKSMIVDVDRSLALTDRREVVAAEDAQDLLSRDK